MRQSTVHRIRTFAGLLTMVVGLLLVPRTLESSPRTVVPIVLLAIGLWLIGTTLMARFTFSRARRVLRQANR